MGCVAALVWYTRVPAPEGRSGETINLSTISTSTRAGGYTVTPETVTVVSRPDYKAPIIFSASLSADAKAAIEAQFSDIQTTLGKDPMNFEAWMRLGTLHKIAGDYKAAEAIWIYAGKQWTAYEPHANLGDLYLNFLRDYPKAEVEFKAALGLNPPYTDDLKAGLKAAQSHL